MLWKSIVNIRLSRMAIDEFADRLRIFETFRKLKVRKICFVIAHQQVISSAWEQDRALSTQDHESSGVLDEFIQHWSGMCQAQAQQNSRIRNWLESLHVQCKTSVQIIMEKLKLMDLRFEVAHPKSSVAFKRPEF